MQQQQHRLQIASHTCCITLRSGIAPSRHTERRNRVGSAQSVPYLPCQPPPCHLDDHFDRKVGAIVEEVVLLRQETISFVF